MQLSPNIRHTLYVSSTRADYGLMRDTLKAIDSHPGLRLSILATGMHLSKDYGNTIKDIESDGFHIIDQLPTLASDDTPLAMAQSIGSAVLSMSEAFEKIRPNFVILEGDRGEFLAAAIAAAHMGIAVVHVSGGDVTGTMVDESIRHAITKLSHIHFPGTDLSARRILNMGEDPWRIHMVGTPGSNVKAELRMEADELERLLQINLSQRIFLVIQHPVTSEVEEAPRQMRETMEAVAGFQEEMVIILPNSDAGGREMTRIINEYEHLSYVHTFSNLPRPAYVSLMSVASLMVGNSSSALTEAPGFGLPAVNVGTRQLGRERGGNVVDVANTKEEIRRSVKQILVSLDNPDCRAKWNQTPYQDINVAEQISQVLSEIEMGPRLIQKRFYDGVSG
jgi:GDP/UDP-N,N'-diacetylbacillosamine 2-epimerase (hydrolysing)